MHAIMPIQSNPHHPSSVTDCWQPPNFYKKEETCKKAHAATGSYTATTATQKDSGY